MVRATHGSKRNRQETKNEFPNIIMKDVIHTRHASGLIWVTLRTPNHIYCISGVSSMKTILFLANDTIPDLRQTIGGSGYFFLCQFSINCIRPKLLGRFYYERIANTIQTDGQTKAGGIPWSRLRKPSLWYFNPTLHTHTTTKASHMRFFGSCLLFVFEPMRHR
jgi:hypothetical protein